MSDELFPPESVAMDSPRLAWIKAHPFLVNDDPDQEGDAESGGRYAVWFPDNTMKNWETRYKHPMPRDYGLCGYGDTIDDALAELAQIYGLKLWNEN